MSFKIQSLSKQFFREAQLARERIAREVAERLEKEYAEEIAKRSKGANIAPPSSLLMESSDFEPPQIGKNLNSLFN